MAGVATQSPSEPKTLHHAHDISHDHAHLPERRKSSVADVDDTKPSQEMLDASKNLTVYDQEGNAHLFSSLYSESGRDMIIFVRHFLCGICQDFLRSLNASFTPEDLSSVDPPISLKIVGCGQPEVIQEYAARSNCKFPIYADPSRRLYDVLGMCSTLAQGPTRPEYQTTSMSTLVVKSIVQGLTSGSHVFKGGNMGQVGGEFLFENGQVTWCHRMRNTRDHTSIPELREIIGFR